jgi:2-polyprenyl-3-methyl-5-hydroxy-6-metoxy-1,4-benzoquinol methylase
MEARTRITPPCYLCGKPATTLVAANSSYSYLRCDACGYRRRHPLPTQAEEELLYEDQYYSDRGLVSGLDQQSSLLRELIEGRVVTLTQLNGGPGRLLDVGAGTGLFMEASIRRGWEATGLETSEAAARIAAGNTSGRVLRGTLEEVDLVDQFDAATLWDVLEHVPDPRATLRSIRTRLRAGGLVGISLPNVLGLKARVQGDRWRYFQHSFGHISHFSPRTLEALLRQADYVPLRVTTTGAFNLGRVFGLDPLAVREEHRLLRWTQTRADGAAGALGLGESLVAFARRP